MALLWNDIKKTKEEKENFFLSQNINNNKFLRISDSFEGFYHPLHKYHYFALGGSDAIYGELERFDKFFINDTIKYIKSKKDKHLIISTFINEIKNYLNLINKNKHTIYLFYISDNDLLNEKLTGSTFKQQFDLYLKLKKENYKVYMARLILKDIEIDNLHTEKTYRDFNIFIKLRKNTIEKMRIKIPDIRTKEYDIINQRNKKYYVDQYKKRKLNYDELSKHYLNEGLDSVSSVFSIIWEDNASDKLVQEFSELISQNSNPPNKIPNYMTEFIEKQKNLLYDLLLDSKFNFRDFYKIDNLKRTNRNSRIKEYEIFRFLVLFMTEKNNKILNKIIDLFVLSEDINIDEFLYYLKDERIEGRREIFLKKINERNFINELKN